MTDAKLPPRIGIRRNAAGEWEKRFIWPEFQANSDETVYIREEDDDPALAYLRKCPNCGTMTEVVSQADIETSFARRMIEAENVGWKRGEERHAGQLDEAREILRDLVNALVEHVVNPGDAGEPFERALAYVHGKGKADG